MVGADPVDHLFLSGSHGCPGRLDFDIVKRSRPVERVIDGVPSNGGVEIVMHHLG